MRETFESDFESPQSAIDHEIANLGPWFHNLHLPDGARTAPNHPLGDFPAFKWSEIAPHIPKNLSGWSALDIGCNAGFYSFELAKRGAKVTAIDLDPHYLAQAKWAAEKFELSDKIEFRQMQVYDFARASESYDLVWFMGIFYHLRYPLLALDIISRCTKKLMVFQALTSPGEDSAEIPENLLFSERDQLENRDWPKMAFIENRMAGDPTNWWIPNHACIEGMLRSSGFRMLDRPGHEIYLCEPVNGGRSDSLATDEYLSATGQVNT